MPTIPDQSWDDFSGRGDPAQRFRIYTLCTCGACEGTRKVDEARCAVCKGEGRERVLVATCGTPEALGVAIVTLGREGEFLDEDGNPCDVGVLDIGDDAEKGRRWLLNPWRASPSPRNVSDAGRVLATARKREG